MAKLAGAMLAMMTIGNNSQRELSPAAVQADPARLAQAKDMRQVEPPEVEQIHRRR